MKGSFFKLQKALLSGTKGRRPRSEGGMCPRHGAGRRSEPWGTAAPVRQSAHSRARACRTPRSTEPALGVCGGRGCGVGGVLGGDRRHPAQPDLEPRSIVQRGHCTFRPHRRSQIPKAALRPWLWHSLRCTVTGRRRSPSLGALGGLREL